MNKIAMLTAIAFAMVVANASISTAATKGKCYSDKECKKLLVRNVTKKNCDAAGGKSWKASGTKCTAL